MSEAHSHYHFMYIAAYIGGPLVIATAGEPNMLYSNSAWYTVRTWGLLVVLYLWCPPLPVLLEARHRGISKTFVLDLTLKSLQQIHIPQYGSRGCILDWWNWQSRPRVVSIVQWNEDSRHSAFRSNIWWIRCSLRSQSKRIWFQSFSSARCPWVTTQLEMASRQQI